MPDDHRIRLVLPVTDGERDVTAVAPFVPPANVNLREGLSFDLGGLGAGLPRQMTIDSLGIEAECVEDAFSFVFGTTSPFNDAASEGHKKLRGQVIAYLAPVTLPPEKYAGYLTALMGLGFTVVEESEAVQVAPAGTEV